MLSCLDVACHCYDSVSSYILCVICAQFICYYYNVCINICNFTIIFAIIFAVIIIVIINASADPLKTAFIA